MPETEVKTESPRLPVPVPKNYDQARVEGNFWPKFKRVCARVPGAADILALYYYMASGMAPVKHKLAIVATLAYFIMPIDAIPDFLGPLGYTDDVAAAMGLIAFIGSGIMAPYRRHARKWLKGEVGLEADGREGVTASSAPPAAAKAERPGGSGEVPVSGGSGASESEILDVEAEIIEPAQDKPQGSPGEEADREKDARNVPD